MQFHAVKQLCFSVIKASYSQPCFSWFGKHVPNEIQHMNCFVRAVKWKILIHISAEKYFVGVGGKWSLCSTCTSISGSQLFGHLTISLVICRWSTTSTPIAPSGITLRGVWWGTGPPKAANYWTPIKHTPPAPAAISPTLPSSWPTVKSPYVTHVFHFVSVFSFKLTWLAHSVLHQENPAACTAVGFYQAFCIGRHRLTHFKFIIIIVIEKSLFST